MLFTPLGLEAEQEEARRRIEVPREVSVAVVKHAAKKITIVHNKLKQNEIVSATDYASAASALEAQFANFEETGLTRNVEKWMAENRIAERVLREPEFAKYPIEVRDEFARALSEHGLPYIHKQIVRSLYAHAELAANRGNGGRFAHACCGPCAVPWLSIGSLYLSIVAVAITGPAGVVVALTYATIAIGGVGLLTGC
jgi:hypothetical protein